MLCKGAHEMSGLLFVAAVLGSFLSFTAFVNGAVWTGAALTLSSVVMAFLALASYIKSL